MRTSASPLLLLPFVLGFAAGCLFNTDTEGLKCSRTDQCQSGQTCVQGVCSKGSGDGTDGGSSGGSGSSSASSSASGSGSP
jgi:hypothetical protein